MEICELSTVTMTRKDGPYGRGESVEVAASLEMAEFCGVFYSAKSALIPN